MLNRWILPIGEPKESLRLTGLPYLVSTKAFNKCDSGCIFVAEFSLIKFRIDVGQIISTIQLSPTYSKVLQTLKPVPMIRNRQKRDCLRVQTWQELEFY